MNIRSEKKKKKNRNNQRVVRHPSLDAARAHTLTSSSSSFFQCSLISFLCWEKGENKYIQLLLLLLPDAPFLQTRRRREGFQFPRENISLARNCIRRRRRRTDGFIISSHPSTHARAHTHTVLASQMSLNLTAIFVQSLFSSSLSTQCAAVHTHTHRRTDERTREGGRRGEESKGDFLLFFFFARSPLMMTWSPTPQAAATANTDDDDDDVVVC